MSSIHEDKAFEVTKEFEERQLGGQSMLFTNNVGMFLIKNKNDVFDCLSEMHTSAGLASECLPESAKIRLGGVQFVIETKGEITKETIEKLDGFGIKFQSGDAGFSEDDVCNSTFFMQQADFWSEDFEKFLDTYPQFLQKKYKKMKRHIFLSKINLLNRIRK